LLSLAPCPSVGAAALGHGFDVILVEGESVDFSYRPADGDRISAYPVFESFDIKPLVRLRPQPLRQNPFRA
jgi:hypothetical protein